jgi:hypothetical protein
MKLHFVAPADSGWGEVHLALRMAAALRETGTTSSFIARPRFQELVRDAGFACAVCPDTHGQPFLQDLRKQIQRSDGWVLVDLFLGALELVRRGVHPEAAVALGPPLIGLDTWGSPAGGLDVFAELRQPAQSAWASLERKVVPVPFAPLDTPMGTSMLPTVSPAVRSSSAVRAGLGLGDEPLAVVCSSWWQHQLLTKRRDLTTLLGLYLQALPRVQVVHVGPRPLGIETVLGPRCRRLGSMQPAAFHDLVRASDVVLSLNAAATTNTTAVALGTPVLCLVQSSSARSLAEVAFQFGTPRVAARWMRAHLPVDRCWMWPMAMVDVLRPLLDTKPYGGLMQPTELLNEEAVLAALRANLLDRDHRASWEWSRSGYLRALAQLPGPSARVAGLL